MTKLYPYSLCESIYKTVDDNIIPQYSTGFL